MDIFSLEMLVNYLECLCLSHSDEQAKGKLLGVFNVLVLLFQVLK